MACYEAGTIIELDAREAVTLSDVRGSTLRVTRGTLWLTQENDTHDVILRAGDNWVVEKQGATVVEAQDDVVLCVVGRHVEPTQAAANDESFVDWRDWVDRLTSLSGRPTPYY
jgi:hypothetical protein